MDKFLVPNVFALGHYMYINVASKKPNYMARLITSTYPARQATCVRFYYNMYGANINRLNIYYTRGKAKVLLYRITGNKGQGWKLAQRNVRPSQAFQVSIYCI